MEMVKQIHDSYLYGTVVEAGCGAALTTQLTDVSGSSKTLYSAVIPYSKECEHKLYGEFDRSVSMEFTEKAADFEINQFDKLTFALVTSWQMNDGVDGKITHGWYTLKLRSSGIDITHSLHFTMPYWKPFDRQRTIRKIGELGVMILHAASANKNIEDFMFSDTDFCLDQAYVNGKPNYSLLLNKLDKSNNDYFLMFESGEPHRLCDLSRDTNEFIIQKGSFNPLHHQHVEMMKHTGKLYPHAEKCFLISTYVYDKPHVDVDDLVSRIKFINDHGYSVMICKEVFFYSTFEMLMLWFNGKKFYMPMGSDTINRIYETDASKVADDVLPFYIEEKVRRYGNMFKFVVHTRTGYEINENVKFYGEMVFIDDTFVDDGTSSTKIRNGQIKNLIDER